MSEHPDREYDRRMDELDWELYRDEQRERAARHTPAPASENVLRGWLGIPVPPIPKHRNGTRAGYRKTGAKRPRP